MSVRLCGQMWDNAEGSPLGQKSTIASGVHWKWLREGTEETSQVVMGGGVVRGGWTGVPEAWIYLHHLHLSDEHPWSVS